MAIPSKLGEAYISQNLTGNILYGNVSQSQPSKSETIWSLVGGFTGLALGGVGYAMAAKNTSQGGEVTKEQQAQMQENAMISYLSSPEGVANELSKLDTTIEKLNDEQKKLSELLTGKAQKDSANLEKQIENIDKQEFENTATQEKLSADVINQKIAQRDAAQAGIESLKMQFKIDQNKIKNLTNSANATLGNITLDGAVLNEPTVSDNGTISGQTYNQQFQNFLNTLEKQAPSKDDKDYERKSKSFNQYTAALLKQGEVQSKDNQLREKASAKVELNTLKVTYGENLDGNGGTYKTQMDTYQNQINEVNTLEQQCPTGFAAMSTRDNLVKRKAELDSNISQYTSVTTTNVKGKDGKETGEVTTKKELDTKTIQNRLKQINQLLTTAIGYQESLKSISSMQSNVSALQTQSDIQNEKDGNWFSRTFFWGKKGRAQRSVRKDRKETNRNIANTQEMIKQAAKALIEKNKFEAEMGT